MTSRMPEYGDTLPVTVDDDLADVDVVLLVGCCCSRCCVVDYASSCSSVGTVAQESNGVQRLKQNIKLKFC